MSKKTININEIKSELKSKESEIKIAEGKLEKLKEKKLKMENPVLIKDENDILEITHNANTVDIQLYKEKIVKLKKELEKKGEILKKLKEENEKLKKEKNIIKKESKEDKNMILNIKDLYQSIGLKIRKDTKDENDNEVITNEENIKMENPEIINKKVKEYENIFDELKEKANQINLSINKQNEINKENRNYVNEIQNYAVNVKERLNILVNNKLITDDGYNMKLKDYNIIFEKVSNILYELDNIILENKDTYGHNLEYNLTKIEANINNLNKDENKNEINFKNKCDEIELIINEIKIIINNFVKIKINMDSKNKIMEEEMKKLKTLHNEEIINQNKKNEMKKKKEEEEKKKKENEKKNKAALKDSFLYNVKNTIKKLDIYKTVNLFQNKDELKEDLEESKLLKKNYHEICYIYDDYEIHDIYYTLKAIVLPNNSNFTLASYYFPRFNKIEIEEFDLDDVPSEYKQESNILISFKIELYHMESLKVHIKYKEIRDSDTLNIQGIKQNKIYRSDYYGLDNSLSGINAKYSLIIKGSYIIVNFDDYFFIRNTNNEKEVEYMWGGIVPPKGKTTRITFSKKEVTWSFERVIKFHSNSLIKRTKFLIPIEFVGGNNEIINITPSSAQANDIILDEKKRQYIFKYTNNKYKKGELIIKGEFKNRCKGEWNVDLTDKEIEKLMPEEDIKDKEQLKKIAMTIINDFDNENKDSDFEYLDFMKIGIWVKNNIKYNYGYIGKKCSALKIYKMKAGVSYHCTRLSNALLYSLGYKVINVSGYYCKNGLKFDQYNIHAFSLIKLDDNKWHPFDATFGIFTGKLHVGYVFKAFDNRDLVVENKNIIFDKNEMNGKIIN